MDRFVKKYIYDIQFAISTIESFTEERERRYEVFLNDVMFRSAVERQIAIIGEALNKAIKISPELPISNAKKIIGTRNYIVHAYDSLQPHILWAIVINDLPILKKEIEDLLII